jgi:YfiH family protein
MIFTSNLLKNIPTIRHGFGTRSENFPDFFKPAWEASHPRWKQIHGTQACEVQSAHQDCGEVDALYTFKEKLPLAVVSADCVPILLAEKSGRGVAAIHSGWRGTRAGIVTALGNTLVSRGAKLENWVAAIGPAIGECCYEVSEELAREFGSSTRMLNLTALVSSQLKAIGLEKIETVGGCTRCSEQKGEFLFESYRRDGGGTREYSVIEIISSN